VHRGGSFLCNGFNSASRYAVGYREGQGVKITTLETNHPGDFGGGGAMNAGTGPWFEPGLTCSHLNRQSDGATQLRAKSASLHHVSTMRYDTVHSWLPEQNETVFCATIDRRWFGAEHHLLTLARRYRIHRWLKCRERGLPMKKITTVVLRCYERRDDATGGCSPTSASANRKTRPDWHLSRQRSTDGSRTDFFSAATPNVRWAGRPRDIDVEHQPPSYDHLKFDGLQVSC
jgi:hypothetical protein